MGYGRDLLEKKGILGTVDSSPQDQVEYADQTFGPNMYDIAGPIRDVEESDLPFVEDDITETDLPFVEDDITVSDLLPQDVVDDITETELMIPRKPERSRGPMTYKKRLEDWNRLQEPQTIPGYTTSYVDEFAPEEKFEDYIERGEEPLPITPYDDSAHEFGMGLGKFFKEMPESMKPDWEDYLEYVGRLGDMPGGKLTYDEWHRMMRRRR